MLKTIWDVLEDAYARFYADDGFPNSGNIAYCIILAVFPFLIFLFSLTGFFVDADMANQAVDQLISIIPAEIIRPLEAEIKSLLTETRHDLLTISGFFTLWTASRGIESLRNGLNRAYRLTETRPLWWRIIQDLLFVVGGAIVALVLTLTILAVPTIWTALTWCELRQGFRYFRTERIVSGEVLSTKIPRRMDLLRAEWTAAMAAERQRYRKTVTD